MRIYVGPPLEKFCARKMVKGTPQYAGSYLCKRSQAQYRMKYGTKVLKKRARSKAEEDEAMAEKRARSKAEEDEAMAEYLQQKAAQAVEKQNFKAISCVDRLVMKKLKEITEGPSDAQLEANETSKLNLEKKRKLIGEMLKPESQFLKEKR